MNQKTKRTGLLILAIILYPCLNLNPQNYFEHSYAHWGWNFSLLSTFLILLIFRFRDPKNWKDKLGINFNNKDLIGFLITTSILLVGVYFLVNFLAEAGGYNFKHQLLFYKNFYPPETSFMYVFSGYLYFIPQTFNEEMIVGALLLFGLERKFKKLNTTIIAIGVSLVFCLTHQAFWAWNPYKACNLTVITVLSLFFIGVLRNSIILKTRKITYAWAIHLSFNLIFFSGFYFHQNSGECVREPEQFNIVFGNITMLIISGLAAILSLVYLNSKRIRHMMA